MNIHKGAPSLEDVEPNYPFWAAIRGKFVLVRQSRHGQNFVTEAEEWGQTYWREDIKKWAHCEPPVILPE